MTKRMLIPTVLVVALSAAACASPSDAGDANVDVVEGTSPSALCVGFFCPRPKPDLHVFTWVLAPDHVSAPSFFIDGTKSPNELGVNIGIENLGAGTLAANSFVISEVKVSSASETRLHVWPITNDQLKTGQMDVYSAKLGTLASYAGKGPYVLHIQVDVGGDVSESNENNNVTNVEFAVENDASGYPNIVYTKLL